jgi:hypothetical protein
MPPSQQQKGKKAKPKSRRRGDNPEMEPKAYTLPSAVILEIRKAASLYRSHGRAAQVGTEILKQIPKPLDIPESNPTKIKRRTYRQSARTPAKS